MWLRQSLLRVTSGNALTDQTISVQPSETDIALRVHALVSGACPPASDPVIITAIEFAPIASASRANHLGANVRPIDKTLSDNPIAVRRLGPSITDRSRRMVYLNATHSLLVDKFGELLPCLP